MKKGEKPNAAISVVIPNLNGAEDLTNCIDSLLTQSLKPRIIVVDNASTDKSLEIIQGYGERVELIQMDRNYGFAGGVNPGIRRAIERGDKYVALLNNDAVADKNWLLQLHTQIADRPDAGIVTSKIISTSREFLDSTGDFYTSWGLPYPRGRSETDLDKYDHQTTVFAASGGASIYRVDTLKRIGLFDEDFFAYYEDVDISFRARLAGWEVLYAPRAIVYHHIGATSSRIHGFAAKQTARNLPFLLLKNVPMGLMPEVLPRFLIIYSSLVGKSMVSGNARPVLLGILQLLILLPKKLWQRHKIQSGAVVSAGDISLMLIHDLPPDAKKLRKLRARWWRLTGRGHSYENSN